MESHTIISKPIHRKALAVELISYGFVILFIYAGLYKLLDFQVFVIWIEYAHRVHKSSIDRGK